LAFSKELLPVGTVRCDRGERPMAVSEHLVERMLDAGVTRLCFVVGTGKGDIIDYYADRVGGAEICYVVQRQAAGLCDALFRALPFLGLEDVACVGLPDTIWYPRNGFSLLDAKGLSFLLFPVDNPEHFDAVEFGADGAVSAIEVKVPTPRSHWVWGAFKITGRVLRELHSLWLEPGRGDEYLGTLVNAYLARGGKASAVAAGTRYVDVGTPAGYREALRLLEMSGRHDGESSHPVAPSLARPTTFASNGAAERHSR